MITLKKIKQNGKYFIENDFLIEINNISAESQHTHDFIEFVYMLKGKSVHSIDGYKHFLKSGDLLIINYNQTHSFNGDPNALFCNILIKPEFIDNSLKECKNLWGLFDTPHYNEFKNLINVNSNVIKFSPEEKNCFENMILLIRKEQYLRSSISNFTTRAGINFIMTIIFKKMCESSIEEFDNFKNVLDYIEKNYYQDISARELSELCHYNPSYFSRIFKKYTGITFSDYLKKTRISNACRLIKESDSNISDIYDKVGYTNKTNFYKHFKQITNKTPLEYKKHGE